MLAHAREVQGLVELAHAAGVPTKASAPLLASGIDFVLEGLYATKKIGRSDERGYHGDRDAGAAADARGDARRRAADADGRRARRSTTTDGGW